MQVDFFALQNVKTQCADAQAGPHRCCSPAAVRFSHKEVQLVWYLIYFDTLWLQSRKACDHLLGKGWPLGFLVCGVFLCFVTFPCCVLVQVWYLIVSIPDICLLLYFLWHLFSCYYLLRAGILWWTSFGDQFKRIFKCQNMDTINPITVYSYGFLFNYTIVCQASYSMIVLT